MSVKQRDLEYWLIVIATAAAMGTVVVTLTDRCTCRTLKPIEKINSAPTFKVYYLLKEVNGLT